VIRLPRRHDRVAIVVAASLSFGCRTSQTLVKPDPHDQRMVVQPKLLPYAADPSMPDGLTMQQPPEGTLRTDAIAGAPLLATGRAGDHYASRIPLTVDRPLVEAGRVRFETFCGPCHGVLGDAVTVVAEKMGLRKPPSLHEARIRDYPPGRIFVAIRQGYGLMPSYAVQLSVAETWGVVAYVRALQLARGAHVYELPGDLRAKLEGAPEPPPGRTMEQPP
jgi:mono/diheme cytochrome c family protein